MYKLGKMKKVEDLRQVWPNEASDFTPWLAEEENIKILSDTIGLDIEVEETESKVGNFSADIVGIDTVTHRKVIIENQLEDSNHCHLGQIITYAAGQSASTIIWIVKNARDEHRAAIEWLNRHMDEDVNFFLIELELWQIDNSLYAPKFNAVEEPNEWSKQVKSMSMATAETPATHARMEFWTAFNDYAFINENYKKEFKKHKASIDHWYDLNLGNSNYHIAILYQLQRNELQIEFYMTDKLLYKYLYDIKNDIENCIGNILEWKELPNKKASRILLTKSFDLSDKSLEEEEFNWIMENTVKFKHVFQKLCKQFYKSK